MKNTVYFQVFLVKILRKLALKVSIFDNECEAELRADAVCFVFSTTKEAEEGRQIEF